MRIPFADLGINGVNLDDEIKPALFRIFRIKIYITAKIHKLTPNSRKRMLYLKEKIGMDGINLPLLGCGLKRRQHEKKKQKD
jgi:hypothetical protein